MAGQQWGRALVIGCLWYVAAELAWDGMERRDGRNRSRDVDISRVREVSTILALSTGATAVSVAAAGFAPNRTLLVLAAAAVVCSVILIVATRHLASLTGDDPAPGGPAEPIGE